MIILGTSRLILREFETEDVNALARVLSDPETMQYYPAPFDQAGVADWIARNRQRYKTDGFGLWAMTLRSNGELVGDCGLVRQHVVNNDEIEIGYHTRRDQWGKGLAPEAAAACRDYGFQKLPLDRLISLIRPENTGSRRVAEKIGMRVASHVLWRDIPHLLYAVSRKKD